MHTHTFTNDTMVFSVKNRPRRRSVIELLPLISRMASQLSVLIFKMHHVQSVLLDIIQSLLIFLFTALLKDITLAFNFDYTRKCIFKGISCLKKKKKQMSAVSLPGFISFIFVIFSVVIRTVQIIVLGSCQKGLTLKE